MLGKKNIKLENNGRVDKIDVIFCKYADELFANCNSVDDCRKIYDNMMKTLGSKCTKRIGQLEKLKAGKYSK